MKKLKFLVGGQPFRSTDFEVIQEEALKSFRQLLAEVASETVILSGLNYTIPSTEANAPFTVPSGYLWDGVEVCAVAEATFNYDAAKQIYLRLQLENSAPRTIAGVNQYVMVERKYQLFYLTAPLVGDITFADKKRLKIATDTTLELTQQHGITSLNAGYAATSGGGLYTLQNGYGESMILCTFTASAATGVLCTLSEDMRPALDTPGWYRAGNTIQPLSVRANGNVELVGTVTSGTNYIAFRYNKSISIS